MTASDDVSHNLSPGLLDPYGRSYRQLALVSISRNLCQHGKSLILDTQNKSDVREQKYLK